MGGSLTTHAESSFLHTKAILEIECSLNDRILQELALGSLSWNLKTGPRARLCSCWLGVGGKLKPDRHKMKAKRKTHEPEFKARVSLEVLKGVKTIQQIAGWQRESQSELSQ